jgi:hypothetical protein
MPLRPDLYDRLRLVFGEVKIAFEDEEMVFEILKGSAFTGDKDSLDIIDPGEYYRVSCPFCHDTRHRLWINHRWAFYVPGVGMNLWLCCCYNEQCLEQHSKRVELHKRVFVQTEFSYGPKRNFLNKGKRRSEYLAEAELPGLMLRVDDLLYDNPARVYLESRGYDVSYLSKTFGVCYPWDVKPRYAPADGRIIIPIVMTRAPRPPSRPGAAGGPPAPPAAPVRRLLGWQARHVGDLPDWRGTPKYYSMPGMKKTEMLYNYDGAMKSPYVVIVEGATDVWSYGPEAVALFGKKISSAQREMLHNGWGQGNRARSGPSLAVVLLDGDAVDERVELADALSRSFDRVVPVALPVGCDPGDYEQDEIRAIVQAAVRAKGVEV